MRANAKHKRRVGLGRLLLATTVAGLALFWLLRRQSPPVAENEELTATNQPDQESDADLEEYQVPGVDPLPPRNPPM